MSEYIAQFRFYEELNDFLPEGKRKQTLEYAFNGHPAIKDPIEAIGVPHTEIDLILANGRSVGFYYHLRNNDRIAVYPVFESFDISPLVKLRDKPLRSSAFVVDVNLGKLARLLRMRGFDVKYRNDYSDPEIVHIATSEGRIVLTRDRRLLYAKAITHGYWVRSDDPKQQIVDVQERFDLYSQIAPFHRCLQCNGLIKPVDKASIIDELEPNTKLYYEEFFRCRACGKIYWKGTHFEHMQRSLKRVTNDPRDMKIQPH